jgi:xanthine dehydrogenase accessory factor
VVGDGVVADALSALALYLEWSVAVSTDREHCVRELEPLTRGDAVVVLSHDLELASPTLKAALGGGAGYVGALGARRTQAAARSGCRTTASCLPRSPAFAVLLGLT